MPKLSWQLDWIILSPLFILLTATRLAPRSIPIHDSMQVFQAFHYFYSNLLFDGTLPGWLPYGSYGMPFDLWATFCLTPASYLAAGAGKLLGVTDTLLLFKLAMALEELAFVVGLYALCRLVLKDRNAVLFVCIGAMLGLNWQFQLWWNFRMFYMVPAGLAFLVLFFMRGQPHYVWLSGSTFAISLIGNLPYYAPLYLFMVTVFVALLQVQMPVSWRSFLTPSAKNVTAFLVFLLVAGLYVHSVRYDMSSLSMSTGRDVRTGGTNLGNFLTHGGNPDVLDLFRQAVYGWPVINEQSRFSDQSFYLGLLTWFLLGWAVLRVRSPLFLALAGTTFVLLWMSAAGMMALAIFHLPTMSWFRHTGLVYNLCKVLLLVCAGFGFEDFIERARPFHMYLLIALALFVADSLMHIRFVLVVKGLLQDSAAVTEWKAKDEQLLEVHSYFVVRILLYVAAALAVLLGARRLPGLAGEVFRSPLVPAAFLLVYAFDMASFMYVSQYAINVVPESLVSTLETLRAAPLEYVERSEQPPAGRGQEANRLMEFARYHALPGFRSGMNQVTYALLHQDPCTIEVEPGKTIYFSPFHVKAVDAMLDLRLAESAAPSLRGCDLPKLRLVSPAGLVVSQDEFFDTVNAGAHVGAISLGAQDNELVLTADLHDGSVLLRHFAADRVDIEVDRPGHGPAWLIYLDAYHPDWRARVNGVEATVQRGCLAFKAVEVPSGKSTVEFAFRPGFHFRPAYWIGALGTVLWVCLFPILLSASKGDTHQPLASGDELADATS